MNIPFIAAKKKKDAENCFQDVSFPTFGILWGVTKVGTCSVGTTGSI